MSPPPAPSQTTYRHRAAAPPARPALAAERRMRAAGGPIDRELHVCRCGAVFPAAPTTSVSCPLCGVHQAW